ncbi:hypothetical protein ABQF17_14980 [Mycolicibacterium elephantis]
MIDTSEGSYFPGEGHYEQREDCLSVRIWAEAVDAEYVAVHMSGHDERRDIGTFVYLQADDALNLAEEMQKAVERQERWATRPQLVAAESN